MLVNPWQRERLTNDDKKYIPIDFFCKKSNSDGFDYKPTLTLLFDPMIEQLLIFAEKHWILSSLLVVILIGLFWEESKQKTGGFHLSLPDATQLINREQSILIDIRDKEIFQNGYIHNALHFPVNTILADLPKLTKYQKKTIILIDNAGYQSAKIARQLRKAGFPKVYILVGGIKTWIQAGLPLIKPADKK